MLRSCRNRLQSKRPGFQKLKLGRSKVESGKVKSERPKGSQRKKEERRTNKSEVSDQRSEDPGRSEVLLGPGCKRFSGCEWPGRVLAMNRGDEAFPQSERWPAVCAERVCSPGCGRGQTGSSFEKLLPELAPILCQLVPLNETLMVTFSRRIGRRLYSAFP